MKRTKAAEHMSLSSCLPARPPFGWTHVLRIPLAPRPELVLSPRAAAAHPLAVLSLEWLIALHACPRLQLFVFRSASALLRCKKTARDGGSVVLSNEQLVLLEVAALGLMLSAGGGSGKCQPVVCADAAVAAILRSKLTAAPFTAADDDNWRSLPFIIQQTVACLFSASTPPCHTINVVVPLPDGTVHLPSSCADCCEPVLLLVCACSSGARLPDSFVAGVSKCKYSMGSSTACGRGGIGMSAAAVYVLQEGQVAEMADVFMGAVELSHALDACYDDDDDGIEKMPVVGSGGQHDVESSSSQCPLGFFMSPRVSEGHLLATSRDPLESPQTSSIANTFSDPDFSFVSCLSIQCVGLVPLHNPLVQCALHALLHGVMCNLVSLSLRLLPSPLILPELHNSLSRLAGLKYLALQFNQCSSGDSSSILRAVSQLPYLCSLELLGLDLSSLLLPSFRFSLAAPISSIAFRDIPLPPVFSAGSDSRGVISTAASMPISHMAIMLHACASNLQSLAITGKQATPYQQQSGGWSLFLHATAQCALLHTLDLSKSGIDAVGCVGLAHCLQHLTQLLNLDVSGNPLAAARVTPGVRDMVDVGAGVLMFAHAIKGLTGLRSLLIRKCCMNRCGTVALLQALRAHTSLTHLALGGNQYSGLPHPVHELVTITEGVARVTCASHFAADYDAVKGYAQAIRAVYSGGNSQEHTSAIFQASLEPVNMSSLSAQLLQPSVYHPPAALPQLLLGVICSNSALKSLQLSNLCLPFDFLPLLASTWRQHGVPPIIFADFRCRVDASAGRAQQVADAWAHLIQAAAASYESQGSRLPPTMLWPSFLSAGT
jgi:hypothetical protein